jgi:undecaprenyl diphosphate synthase
VALSLRDITKRFAPFPSDIDIAALDPLNIPAHIAVIMDGNGRWANLRGKQRAAGHKAGIKGVRSLIQAADDLGVRFLTIYSFSTENWSRPIQEVKTLMSLFARTMAREIDAMHDKDVRVRIIGDLDMLPQKTRKTFLEAVEKTEHNKGMTLVVAVNYGSRTEIARAVQAVASRAAFGLYSSEELDSLSFIEESFAAQLDTVGIPDPDLLIRTSGEYRLSNFLLYQLAYSEIYVTQTLWPDFDAYELLRAIISYQGRSRRFGGIDEVSDIKTKNDEAASQ